MELRTLRYFLAVAQEGNITRAADILHLTQPTLSRQIMDLERELGVMLMLRGKNGLTLTDDGTFFRQRAQEIVELADRLEDPAITLYYLGEQPEALISAVQLPGRRASAAWS